MLASLDIHVRLCLYGRGGLFKTEEGDMPGVQGSKHECVRCYYAVLLSVFQLSVRVPQVFQSKQKSESYLEATPSLRC